MKNANWFNAMVEFSNTVKYIQGTWNVPRAIAMQIQNVAAIYKDQKACDKIAQASLELRSQVGF